MNVSSQDARRWILGLWLLTAALAVIREAQNQANPGRPLPRPCVLLGSAAGYTVLGVLSEFLPQVFVPTAIAITLGALVAPALKGGTTPLGMLSGAVQRLDAISGGASSGG